MNDMNDMNERFRVILSLAQGAIDSNDENLARMSVGALAGLILAVSNDAEHFVYQMIVDSPEMTIMEIDNAISSLSRIFYNLS